MNDQSTSAPLLSVVVPAHDEEESIEGVVRDVGRCVVGAVGDGDGEVELVVVDDASSDGTGAVLARLAAELSWLRVVSLARNVGHGAAVAAGMRAARGEWIFQLDADAQFSVDDFPSLWERRLDAGLVLGVRAERHDPAHRLALSTAAALFTSALAGRRLRDVNTPFRVFPRSLWSDVEAAVGAQPSVPSVDTCIVASRQGMAIVEVPVSHAARPHGRSSLDVRRLGVLVARGLAEVVRARRSAVRVRTRSRVEPSAHPPFDPSAPPSPPAGRAR